MATTATTGAAVAMAMSTILTGVVRSTLGFGKIDDDGADKDDEELVENSFDQ